MIKIGVGKLTNLHDYYSDYVQNKSAATSLGFLDTRWTRLNSVIIVPGGGLYLNLYVPLHG